MNVRCYCSCDVIYDDASFKRHSTKLLARVVSRRVANYQISIRVAHASDACDRFDDLRARSTMAVWNGSRCISPSSATSGPKSSVRVRSLEKNISLFAHGRKSVVNIGTRDSTSVAVYMVVRVAYAYARVLPARCNLLSQRTVLCFRRGAGSRGRGRTRGKREIFKE